jgi:hypothetical protein
MNIDMDDLFDLSKPVPLRWPPPAAQPEDLPADWHLAWDERAAIMEYDGGLPRERAEALALVAIIEEMRQHQHHDGDRHHHREV